MQLLNVAFGHMFMSNPPSRRNKYSSYYLLNGLVDYNIMAPLNEPPYIFPCKGYTTGPATATFNSNSISVTLEGTVTHGGGHCQFGISYNDKDFLVLKTVLYTCLLDSLTYTFELPLNTPSGKTTVFWTWINKIGNREYYMECADVNINNENNGNIGGVLNGKELLVVNLPGYPIVPEWGSSTDPSITGENLLLQRKDFSIIASPGNQMPIPSSIPNPTTSSIPTTTLSQISSTSSSTSTKTEDISATNDELCQNGYMECEGVGFKTCVNNKWVYRECAMGTGCKRYKGNYIICDFI